MIAKVFSRLFSRRSFENPAVPISGSAIARYFWGGQSDAGVSVNEKNALELSTVHACVRILSESVGVLPIHTYRKLAGGGKERVDSPVSRLLTDAPNGDQTPASFKETLEQYIVTWGKGDSRIRFDAAGRARALEPPYDPSRVETKYGSGGGIVHVVKAEPVVMAGGDRSVKDLVLDDREVLHVPGLGNGINGYSPIGLARNTLGTDKAHTLFINKFFDNGAWLGGTLEHPGTLSDKAMAHLKESWDSKAGASNAFKPAILEEGLTWKPVSLPSKDAMFLDLRKFTKREICAIFRVPPHMVADLEGGASFSSIELMSLDFVRFTLGIWLAKIEQELTRKLTRERGTFMEFKRDAFTQADTKTRYESYKTALGGGATPGFMTVNEIRSLENLPPVDGGEVIFQPLNVAPLGQEPEPEPEPDPEPVAPDPDPEMDENSRALLLDAVSRWVRGESDRVRRASKRGADEFIAWCADFYDGWDERMVEAVMLPVAFFGEGYDLSTDDIESRLRAVAVRLATDTPISLIESHERGSIGQMLDLWETDRANRITDEIAAALLGVPAGV